MATIDYKDIVDKIIADDGYYDGDTTEPRALKIVEYTNAWGKQCWGVVFEGDGDDDRYERANEFVQNPTVIWEVKKDV